MCPVVGNEAVCRLLVSPFKGEMAVRSRTRRSTSPTLPLRCVAESMQHSVWDTYDNCLCVHLTISGVSSSLHVSCTTIRNQKRGSARRTQSASLYSEDEKIASGYEGEKPEHAIHSHRSVRQGVLRNSMGSNVPHRLSLFPTESN
jgi:hypothetical protein